MEQVLLRLLLPLTVVGVATAYVEMSLPLVIKSYFTFVLYGVVFVVINGVVALLTAFVFNRPQLKGIFARAMGLLKRR